MKKVWTNPWNKAEPMADFPGGGKQTPVTNSLVIDFTHEIERKADSANQLRWRARLKTVESQWGTGGDDSLWCAPTAEVADYVHAAKAARLDVTPGKLTISLPDDIPGSALTVRLRGIGKQVGLRAPRDGAVYRQGETVVLTSPRIGLWGAPPPSPRLKCIYDGPAASVDFPKPARVAGVTLKVFGNPPTALTYRLAVRTASGEKIFAERTVGPGWVVGGHLCPIVPAGQPILGTGIEVSGVEPLKAMSVWALDQ
jgi:hypothetical protein